jgi:hypothetical protein
MWQPTAFAPEGPARPQEALQTLRVAWLARRPRIQTSGTTSKVRECFYPRERFTVEPPNTLQLVRCKVPTSLFSHKRAKPATNPGFLAEAWKRLTARVKTLRLAAG